MTDDPSYRQQFINAVAFLGIKMGEINAKLDYAIGVLNRLDKAATGTTKDKPHKRHAPARNTAAGDIDGSKP